MGSVRSWFCLTDTTSASTVTGRTPRSTPTTFIPCRVIVTSGTTLTSFLVSQPKRKLLPTRTTPPTIVIIGLCTCYDRCNSSSVGGKPTESTRTSGTIRSVFEQ